MIKLYYCSTSNADKHHETLFRQIVAKDRLLAISSRRNQSTAFTSLTGDVLLRYSLCCMLAMQNERIRFSHHIFGKPYLKNQPNCHFSVSHSGKYVVIALSKQNIGIDLVTIRPFNYENLAANFSRQEYCYLLQHSVDKRLDLFYSFWALKESYFKYLGTGLTTPLDACSFDLSRTPITLTETTQPHKPDPLFKLLKLDLNHKVAICHDENIFASQEIYQISLDKLSFFAKEQLEIDGK